jgi:ABC-type Na+ efflux pump permease subunit
VVTYYVEHDTGQIAAAVLLSLGAILVLVFAATLVTVLRRGAVASGPVVLLLSGVVVLVAGLATFAGLSLTLGDLAGNVDDSTLRSLHVLSQELFFPVTVGVSAFFLGAGFATLRTGVLPRWCPARRAG